MARSTRRPPSTIPIQKAAVARARARDVTVPMPLASSSSPPKPGDLGFGGLTHFDASGAARMVDVSVKPETARLAIASGVISMQPATAKAIAAGTIGKGDVLAVARLAAIGAAKRTSEWIPLCHPLRLTGVDVELEVGAREVTIRATVRAFDRSGVEMEALAAVSAAGLTIYDMCKAIDRGMTIGEIRLEEKQGGKSGTWKR
jgi:cyclic pyranopterin phosphate synthase